MAILAFVFLLFFVSLVVLVKEPVMYTKYKELIWVFYLNLALVLINYLLKDKSGIESLVEEVKEISFIDFLFGLFVVQLALAWRMKKDSK